MKRFLNLFVLIFTLIIGGAISCIGLSLSAGRIQWAALLVLGLLIWSLPVLLWSSESDRSSRAELLLQRTSFLSMALVSWLFVVATIRDLIFWAGPHVVQGLDAPRAWILAIALTLIGGWRTVLSLRTREVIVPIAGLPSELEGLRIAQITDLHVGPTIGRAYVEKVVSRVNALQTDLTVLTGDIGDGNPADLEAALAPLAGLHPKGRIFYVPGNHEYYWNVDRWLEAFSALEMRVLMNRGELISHGNRQIWVGGVSDPAAQREGREEKPDVQAAIRGGESTDLRLLLSHRPDPFPQAAEAGFQLQLSGHTHGGQFFPWTWVGRLFHRYFIGLHPLGKSWVYVSPGTGTWGPPSRIGTTPEVTCLKLISCREDLPSS